MTYKVKNIGPKPFVGTLHFSLVIDDPNGAKVPVVRHEEVELAVEEETEVEWSFPSLGKCYQEPNTGYFLMTQSGTWVLNREGETEPYLHPVTITPRATANEKIDASETTFSWQGRTLCIESVAALKAYRIYNVQGGLVATGTLSGTSARIDGSVWQTGLYIVAIVTEEGKTEVYKIQL